MIARRLWPTLFGLVLVVLLALLRLADPPPIATVRDMGFDLEQRLLPRTETDSPVRVIDIDEASLAKIGQWPWPRDVLATLTSRLGELGAAAIGYDALFPEADRMAPGNDAKFATALATTPSVLGFSVSHDAPPPSVAPKVSVSVSGSFETPDVPPLPGIVAPLPQLATAAHGLGNLSLDSDEAAGVVRQVPLLWRNGDVLYPSLSIETLRLALGLTTIVALTDTRGDNTVESLRIGNFTVPTTATGDIVLYDRTPDFKQTIPAASVLADDYGRLRDQIAGRIVLVGTSASGLLDLHATPLAANVPGVMVHAAVIDQIVAGQYLSRADWVQGLEILGSVLAGVLLVVVVLRLGPVPGLLLAAVLIAAMIGAAYEAFALRGWLIDTTFPAIAALLTYGAMVYAQFL
ncbi:MAG TPA: CHASE2 domain-containing protein, partial [Reyranella sp.]